MPWTTKMLVIANRTIESKEIRDAIVRRAATGPVQVMLVAPSSSGAGSFRERRAATARRLARAVEGLRDSGASIEGVVGDSDPLVAVQDAWDPRRFGEIIAATPPTGISRRQRPGRPPAPCAAGPTRPAAARSAAALEEVEKVSTSG